MSDPNRKTPKAAPTAKGAGVVALGAGRRTKAYHATYPRRKRLIVKAVRADGATFFVAGHTAKTLQALVDAGMKGVTASEVSAWTLRFAACIHSLRHKRLLSIITQWEAHEGGRHGRYVLLSAVTILEPLLR